VYHDTQDPAIVHETKEVSFGAPEADFIQLPSAWDEGTPSGDMLSAIVSLRAYCANAIDAAIDLKDEHISANTALVNFIINFGQDEAPNLVVAFAKAVGKTRAQFTAGIGDYFLNHISKAILDGKDVISFFNHDEGQGYRVMAQLDSEAMGLEDTPDYLDDLGISASEFSTFKIQLGQASKNADNQAAVMWLESGAKTEYRSFKQQELDASADKVAHYEEERYMQALRAIKFSWGETNDLHPLPNAAGSAANVVVPPTLPSEDEIDHAAAQAAAQWQAEHNTGVDDLHTAAENEIRSVEQNQESQAEATESDAGSRR